MLLATTKRKETRKDQKKICAAGLLQHSDRGSQYVDGDYLDALRAAGIARSMSRAGNCYDNAAMESFWGWFAPIVSRSASPEAGHLRLLSSRSAGRSGLG